MRHRAGADAAAARAASLASAGRVRARSGSRVTIPNRHRAGEVARAVGVRLPQRPAERGCCAPRPEQDAHDQAHADADGNVFDPHQAEAPSGRLDDVEQDHQCERERRLPCGERDDRRGDPGEEIPPAAAGTTAAWCSCRSPRAGAAPTMKPATVPTHGANGVLPGVQRIRAQYRQRRRGPPRTSAGPRSVSRRAPPAPARRHHASCCAARPSPARGRT